MDAVSWASTATDRCPASCIGRVAERQTATARRASGTLPRRSEVAGKW